MRLNAMTARKDGTERGGSLLFFQESFYGPWPKA